MGRVVDLFEIFISPAHAFTDEVEQFEAGGTGGGLIDIQRFRGGWRWRDGHEVVVLSFS